MVIDKIENLKQYVSLNPLLPRVMAFLDSADLPALQAGRIVIEGEELFANVEHTLPKKKEDAVLESHDKYIDLQIPLTGVETMGVTSRAELPEAVYDSGRDISFYNSPPMNYFAVKPGMFVLFFPQDAHAPAITDEGIKKIVVKIRIH